MAVKNHIRILYLIARLNIGGPALHVISLIKHLPRNKYKTLLVSGNVSPGEGDMSYLAKEEWIKTYLISNLGREISLIGDLKSYKNVRRIIKRFRPDIIHTHTAKAGTIGRIEVIFFNLFRRRSDRIKVVHTFHGHIFHSYFGSLRTRIFILVERFLAFFTDRIIVISPKQRIDICNKYKIVKSKKVKIIPLGFDLKALEETIKSQANLREKYFPHEKEDIFFVGVIGRLTHIKNHYMFLDAIKYLKDIGKVGRFRFLVIGDGELREDLFKYSVDLKLKNYVIFTGWIKDIPSIYSTLDIVTLTSLNEGTPVVLIEAMAAGLPIVSTDVGGVSDLMGGIVDINTPGLYLMENGILVHPCDSESLARALLFITENRGYINGITTRAKKYVLANYSLERLVINIKALYEEILKD